MFSKSHRWYLFNASLRWVRGRWPKLGAPFITGGKEEREPKRKGNAYTELVYVELCSSHGAFHWAQFNKATWNEPRMGVGKSTRIITGRVGVIESCGRVVCVAGTSSCSAVLMWNIKNLQKNFTFLFSTQGTFDCGLQAQAHSTHFWTYSSKALMKVFLFASCFCL